MGLPDAAENSPRVASEKWHKKMHKFAEHRSVRILLLTDYNSRTVPNVREAPHLERTVKGIHTIDGGSRQLPVWWSIIDRLLYFVSYNDLCHLASHVVGQ